MKISSILLMGMLICPTILYAQGRGPGEPPVGANYYSEQKYHDAVKKLENSLQEYKTVMNIARKEVKKNVPSRHQLPDEAIIHIALAGKTVKELKGSDWGMQYQGYPNFLKVLKGFPYFQRLEILKLKLEILKLKDASQSEINEIEKQLRETIKYVEKFKSYTPVD